MTSTENTTETPNPCQREISVEIPAEIVAQQQASVVATYQKHARVPGFRRGKVPAAVIKQRFADEIKKEIVEQLLPRYFEQEAKAQKLAPVAQPAVTELSIEEGQPLKFTARFEVMPEFDVAGYKDVKAEHEEFSVSDEEVSETLAGLQEQSSTFAPVDEPRAIVDGDFAQIAFTSVFLGGEPTEPVKMDDAMVDVGGKNTVAEFSENLRGKKAGEIVPFDVTYAEDFTDKRLAGKTLHYEVTVKGIKLKQTPELNDDFAKQAGDEFNTLEELKTRIRENLLHQKEHEAEHKGKDAIVEQLLAKFDFPVPQAMVEHQIDMRLERGLRSLMQQGLRPEDIKRMDLNRLRDGQREDAIKEVRTSLILDKIAEAEKIEIDEKEFDENLEALAKQSRQTVEAVRARLEENGGLSNLRGSLLRDKALETLYHQK